MPETAAPAGPTRRLAELADRLRASGVPVGVAEVLQAHRVLTVVAPLSRHQAFVALRATFCKTAADRERFAEAFDAVFGPGDAVPGALSAEAVAATCGPAAEARGPSGARSERPGVQAPRAALPETGDGRPRDDAPDDRAVPAAYSALELLAARDVAELDAAARRQVERLVSRLGLRPPTRVGRRLRPARRGRRLDAGATLRAAVARGGEPVELRWRATPPVPRRLVFLCDVSGSMAPYAHLMLRYAHAWMRTAAPVEVFTLGTRVTRVTRDLQRGDADAALAAAQARVPDWSGGTRLGAAFATLNREHADRVGRGAVVVVLSDGWERGDPTQLGDELARLRRCAHRLLWVTPLAGDPRFEPLTRGMVAALPSTDRIMAGHSLAALWALTDVLGAFGP